MNSQKRTEHFVKPEQLLREGDAWDRNAATARQRMSDLAAQHPWVLEFGPAKLVIAFLLCLLLLPPLFFETLLLRPAMQDLLARTAGVENETVITVFSLAAIALITFVVWALAYCGRKTEAGAGAFVCKVASLGVAAVVPAMAIANMLAIAAVDAALQNLPTPGLWDTLLQNMHLAAFSIISLAVHVAIWSQAVNIKDAVASLAVRRQYSAAERRTASCQMRGDSCREAAARSVRETVRQNDQVTVKHGVTFDYRYTDPRIKTLLEGAHATQNAGEANRYGPSVNGHAGGDKAGFGKTRDDHGSGQGSYTAAS